MFKMYTLLAGAVDVKMSVAQMFKLYLSFIKVTVAGADNHVLLLCCECC